MYLNAIDSVTGWVDIDTTCLVAVPALAERSGRIATRQDLIGFIAIDFTSLYMPCGIGIVGCSSQRLGGDGCHIYAGSLHEMYIFTPVNTSLMRSAFFFLCTTRRVA